MPLGRSTRMKTKILPGIALGVLLAILGVVGYKLSPLQNQSADITLQAATCSPESPACSATLPDGRRLEFSVGPRPLRPLQSLQLNVVVDGSDLQTVEVDFKGTDMDMGYNRVKLIKGRQGFSGQAMLPVCVTGTMAWTATVLLAMPAQRIAIPFHFVVAGR